MKRVEKAFRNVKVTVTIFGVIFIGSVIGDIFFETNISILCFFSFPFVIGGVLLYYYLQLKKYREDVLLSKPKRRFKYLDSFYYEKIVHTGESRRRREYFVIHILEDVDTERIYAIDAKATNGHLQKILEDVKIVKGAGREKIRYHEEGIFWLDQEFNDCFYYDGEDVIIKYFGAEQRVNINNELFHTNPEYDVSLLDKATFIMGFAEFNIDN
ncbi:MAG: hypothetical protein J6C46_05660 [Clostridia bacterium]|nr:hypothetical protein [Clostridia bacterium]